MIFPLHSDSTAAMKVANISPLVVEFNVKLTETEGFTVGRNSHIKVKVATLVALTYKPRLRNKKYIDLSQSH